MTGMPTSTKTGNLPVWPNLWPRQTSDIHRVGLGGSGTEGGFLRARFRWSAGNSGRGKGCRTCLLELERCARVQSQGLVYNERVVALRRGNRGSGDSPADCRKVSRTVWRQTRRREPDRPGTSDGSSFTYLSVRSGQQISDCDLQALADSASGKRSWKALARELEKFWGSTRMSRDQWKVTGAKFELWKTAELKIAGVPFRSPLVEGRVRPFMPDAEVSEVAIPFRQSFHGTPYIRPGCLWKGISIDRRTRRLRSSSLNE